MANQAEILNAVNDVIKKLTDEFIQNPMRFFSEKDFHWYFCYLLNRELRKLANMSKVIKTQFNGYRTMTIHQEYGTIGMKRKKIDVVVLNPEDVKKINGPDLKHDGEFLRPLVAIEFGTEKTSKLLNHIDDDCRKLESLGTGTKKKYMVIYYRDLTQSKTGQRHQKHCQKIDAIKKKVKKASKKPDLEVIGIIYYVYDNKYEKVPKN